MTPRVLLADPTGKTSTAYLADGTREVATRSGSEFTQVTISSQTHPSGYPTRGSRGGRIQPIGHQAFVRSPGETWHAYACMIRWAKAVLGMAGADSPRQVAGVIAG